MKSIAKLKDEARKHEQKEEWEKAIQVYLQVLKIGEEGEAEVELPLYNRVGDLCVRLGRPHEAVKHYEQAADRYADAGLYNNAIALCNKAMRYDSHRLPLMRKLGQFSASQGFITDARRYFLEYAERQFANGAVDDALSALEDFANVSDDAEVRELLGRQLKAHGRVEEAVQELQRAYSMRLQEGDTAKAEALRSEIATLDPNANTDPNSRPAAPGHIELQHPDDLPGLTDIDPGAALADFSVDAAANESGTIAGFDTGRADDVAETADFGTIEISGFDESPSVADVGSVGGLEGLEPTTLDLTGVDSLAIDSDLGIEREETSFDDLPSLDAPAGAPDLPGLDDDDAGAFELPELDDSDAGAFDLPTLDDADDAFELPTLGGTEENNFGLPSLEEDDASGFGLPTLDDVSAGFDLPTLDDDDDYELPDPAAGEMVDFGLPSLDDTPAFTVDAADAFTEFELPTLDEDEQTIGLPTLEGDEAGAFELPMLDGDAPGESSLDGDAPGEPSLETDAMEDEGPTFEIEDAAAFELPPLEEPAAADAHATPEERLDAGIADWQEAMVADEAEARTAEFADVADVADVTDVADVADVDVAGGDEADVDLPEAVHTGAGETEPAEAAAGVAEPEPAAADDGMGWTPDMSLPPAPAPAAKPAPPPPRPSAPEGGFIDLGSFLTDDDEETTRFRVQETAPTGDEDRDFAELLSQFKAKVSEHLPPEDAAAHYDLGLAFKEMGLVDEAISEFQIALRAGHMKLKVYEELGHCFLQKEQYNIAEKVLSRALEMKYEDELELIGVYYHLGRAYEGMDRRDRARDAYERVLGMDINFQDVTHRLAQL